MNGFSIVVVGGGQVALLAATALKRALPHRAIALVRTEVDRAAFADLAHTTMPSLSLLHKRIGLTEASLLRRCGATHWLGTRYSADAPGRTSFVIGHGAACGDSRPAGHAQETGDWTLGPSAAIAACHRFALPLEDTTSPLSDIDYALRFSVPDHVAGLLALARHLGIQVHERAEVGVNRNADGTVAAILADGQAITGALYVDCTGPSRRLSGQVDWIGWSGRLPVDCYTEIALAPALSPLDEIRGHAAGFAITSPGRDCTREIRLWSSATGNPAIPKDIDMFGPGRATLMWRDNVVAIGDAAASFAPVGWLNLHLAVAGIERLLELLPGDRSPGVERHEYNRRIASSAERVADFIGAQIMLTGLVPEHAATLQRTIEQFCRRRRLIPMEDDVVPRDYWLQLLGGLFPDANDAPHMRAIEPGIRDRHYRAERRHMAAALQLSRPYAAMFPELIGQAS